MGAAAFGACCTQREDEGDGGPPTHRRPASSTCAVASASSTCSQKPSPESSRKSGRKPSPPRCDLVLSGFATANTGRLEDYYEMQKQMGKGSYGFVALAVKKDSKDTQRAVKRIAKDSKKKDNKTLKLFRKEVEIMSMLKHPHIIRLFETFEDSKDYHLVMEVCHGGELFDRIIRAVHFTEVQAAHCVGQIIKGLNYLHTVGIVHRDLKPENFLCLNDDPIEDNVIKIIDFGLATRFTKGEKLTTSLGTPYYVAPEVLRKSYDELCDMWSCGVITYVLLSGEVPFPGTNSNAILQKVSIMKFSFGAETWQRVSRDARELISKLLVRRSHRLTAEQALEHNWIKLKAPKALELRSSSLISRMKEFQAANKFKKVALQVIANQMDDSRSNSLRQIFNALDKNGDGLLTFAEVKSGLEEAGMGDMTPKMMQMISSIDVDETGTIDYTEFLSSALNPEHYEKEDILWSAFQRFDRDGSGKISRAELEAVLHDKPAAEGTDGSSRSDIVKDIFKDIDQDGDGEIDFEEFKTMMCRSESK